MDGSMPCVHWKKYEKIVDGNLLSLHVPDEKTLPYLNHEEHEKTFPSFKKTPEFCEISTVSFCCPCTKKIQQCEKLSSSQHFCDDCLKSGRRILDTMCCSLKNLERFYYLINNVHTPDEGGVMECNNLAKEVKETTYFVGTGACKICIGKTNQIAILFSTNSETSCEVRFFTESFKNIKIHTLHAPSAGVAAMEDNNFAVAAGNKIVIYSQRGNELKTIAMDTRIEAATGIALYDCGFLILDTKTQDVHFICDRGRWRGSVNFSNKESEKLKTPHSIAINNNKDKLVVSDGNNIKIYSTSSKKLLHHFLTKDSRFEGLCIDSQENIIVANNASLRLSMLSSAAKLSCHLVSGMSNVSDVAVNSGGYMTVLQKDTGMITIYQYDFHLNSELCCS